MNSNMSSSKVMLSYYIYSHTYELEYSCCVIILIYELVYSLYVMRVAQSTLCLNTHITYIIRIRAKLRWLFIMPLGVPKFFTYRSVGSRSRGIQVVSVYASMVLRYEETGECIVPFHGWGVGGRWWQPCTSLVIPHIRLECRGLNYHTRLLADQYSVASRPASYLALILIMYFVWSLTNLCVTILGQCLLDLGISFILSFPFYRLRNAKCVSTILKSPYLPLL
jgi:hypothetical protein